LIKSLLIYSVSSINFEELSSPK